MSRGIFSLNESYNEQVSGDWSTASDVWVIGSPVLVRESPFGYIAGGDTGSGDKLSTVERIDYSNDTPLAAVRGPLAGGRYLPTGNSSTIHAYFAGGEFPSPTQYSSIQRIDYGNDTVTSSPKGTLSVKRSKLSSTGTIDYAYYGGGYTGSAFISTVDRIDYANDSVLAVVKGSLNTGVFYPTATGNQSHGYFHLGNAGGANSSKIDRLDYSSDSTACVTKGSLTLAKYATMGATNGNLYGYWAGGTANPPNVSTVDRLDYSSDTTNAVAKGPLSVVKARVGGLGNSNYGWIAGGSPGPLSSTERLDFSNDTATASVRGPLSVAKYATAAASAASNALGVGLQGTASNIGVNRVPVGTNFGYTFGGYKPSPGYLSAVQRIDYSSDTSTAPQTASLPNAMSNRATVGNTNYAYVQPGTGPAGTNMQRFDYSNDTSGTSAKGGVPEGHANYNTGNEDFGYFSVAHPETSVFRLEYASDTSNALVRTYRTVSNQIYNGGAAGNSSYGYFAGGGQNGTAGGTVMDRIDYSNDTATMTVKGPLTSNQTYGIAANGSANFAYWGGGDGGSGPTPGTRSTVDRLDYSSDTTATVAKGPLTIAKEKTGSTTNTSHGYWTGGGTAGYTTVDRHDYSSDTTACATKGPLTFGSLGHGAGSSRENNLPTENIYSTTVSSSEEVSGTKNITEGRGYMMGGFYPTSSPSTAISTVQRIDFANDTATGVAKGPLSANRSNTAGNVGNQDYGYVGGGYGPVSIIDRTDYSNDTAAAVAKGSLLTTRYAIAGMSNMNYGWWAGGTPAAGTKVERIDFSNDAADVLVRGYLVGNPSAYFTAAAGNQHYGYVALGVTKSEVDRIDYSNDTANAVAKGPLVQVKYAKAGVSNENYAWYGGGHPGPISIIDRIDFSNDTATGLARSQLSVARFYVAGASCPDFGYFIGGAPGGWGSTQGSTVDRLDYSNDTATASPKGPLAAVQGYGAGNGTQSNALPTHRFTISTPFAFGENYTPNPYGYYGAGNNYNTRVERIDYSSDTSSPTLRGWLVTSVNARGGVASLNHGYFLGGGDPEISTVDRIDFSNDLIHASTRGPLTRVGDYITGAGTKDYGYGFGGVGAWPNWSSLVDRINYSNDT